MSLSRRELLRGLLGLGAAACTGRTPRTGRAIAGSIVGANHGRGHLLREASRLAPEAREEVRVAVLGAGIAGLSAAWALERSGLRDFVVLELEDAPGGTACSGVNPVSAYPWGAHYVTAPGLDNPSLLALLEELGAVEGRDPEGRPRWSEAALCREPDERVFYRGAWYEGLVPRVAASPAELRELQAFEDHAREWAAWRDARGRRAFAAPRALGSDAERVRALDRLSMADYLDARGFTSERLRWLVDYACRDDFGCRPAQTSAWAGLHYFAARLEADAPASAPFLTWPEGNGRVVAHLARLAGARLRTGALVAEVAPREGAADVVYLDAREGRVRGLAAEHVVFALPRFLAGRLIVPWRDGVGPARPSPPRYGAWMVANLTLRDRPAERGFPLAWDNVIYHSDSLGYVVATHQSGRDHGATVLTYYRALLDDDEDADRRRLLATPWQAWVDSIVADLRPAHPDLESLLERVDVWLWGHAMPRPWPGTLWSAPLAQAAQPLGRIHFAHTDLSGMALFEEAHYWGVHAAEQVMRAAGHAFDSRRSPAPAHETVGRSEAGAATRPIQG